MPAKCELCGGPMPEDEQMFRYHGHSGPCPPPQMIEIWVREIDPDTDTACWVMCAKGDPGARLAIVQ